MFSLLSSCSERRKAQLDRQKIHDDWLSNAECQKNVIEHLLKHRERNRRMTNDVMKSSFLNYFSETEKMLNVIDEEYRVFEECVQAHKNVCNCL